jgi:hypothetical protein
MRQVIQSVVQNLPKGNWVASGHKGKEYSSPREDCLATGVVSLRPNPLTLWYCMLILIYTQSPDYFFIVCTIYMQEFPFQAELLCFSLVPSLLYQFHLLYILNSLLSVYKSVVFIEIRKVSCSQFDRWAVSSVESRSRISSMTLLDLVISPH